MNHKYDTNDYMTIDSAFGHPKILKELVNQAHARGMRVMLMLFLTIGIPLINGRMY